MTDYFRLLSMVFESGDVENGVSSCSSQFEPTAPQRSLLNLGRFSFTGSLRVWNAYIFLSLRSIRRTFETLQIPVGFALRDDLLLVPTVDPILRMISGEGKRAVAEPNDDCLRFLTRAVRAYTVDIRD